MIKKFKKKIILILTIIFWGILIGILVAVNLSNYQTNQSETKKLLVAQEGIVKFGNITEASPPVHNGKTLSSIYSVKVDEKKRYSVVFSNNDSGYSQEDLINVAKAILNENREDGVFNHFKYKIGNNHEEVIISFIDYSMWEQQQNKMMSYSILIGIIGMIMLFVVAIFLSEWLIKPINIAFEKQKQFISDAGHELKTPLTIMKASLDMLEDNYGEDKYFGYIREENNHMTVLIDELLTLSGLETLNEKINFEKINLSRIVEGTCLPFECLVFEKGLNLELQIKDEIYILGNEKQIRNMIEVLVDNAIKHTYINGTVLIKLNINKGKIILEVKNQGEPIAESERSRIFDRFYRVDKARNRKEGRYGLGLAIASSIAEVHKSSISVECKENWTTFSVKFN